MSTSYEKGKAKGTFGNGRNAEKRVAREAQEVFRRHVVRAAGGEASPKRKYSRQLINMLANRRLRQRGLAS